MSDRRGAPESAHAVTPMALLLPALSVATRDEMQPLADRLGGRLRCATADWPGFGAASLLIVGGPP